MKKIAILAALGTIALLSYSAYAAQQDVCSSISNPPASYASSVFGIAMLIMLAMLTIAAVSYALGYSLRINKLSSFAKKELGEAAITLIIISVFFGAVAGSSSNSISVYASKAEAETSFLSDCNTLYSNSLTIVGYAAVPISAPLYLVSSFLSTFTLSFAPLSFGFSFMPFGGFSLITGILKYLLSLSTALIGISIGVAFFLSVIYNLFPIFFYLGIILRSIPWTRAAGGAFLGLFFGFYVVFPLLLHIFLLQNVLSSPSAAPYSSTSTQSISISAITNAISNLFKASGSALSAINPFNAIQTFCRLIIEPLFYYLFALIMSLLISLDFTELLSSILGSESLASKHTIRGLI